jgi:hypothetical protein
MKVSILLDVWIEGCWRDISNLHEGKGNKNIFLEKIEERDIVVLNEEAISHEHNDVLIRWEVGEEGKGRGVWEDSLPWCHVGEELGLRLEA